MPSDQESDRAYSTAPGTHMGCLSQHQLPATFVQPANLCRTLQAKSSRAKLNSYKLLKLP